VSLRAVRWVMMMDKLDLRKVDYLVVTWDLLDLKKVYLLAAHLAVLMDKYLVVK
jgi:hypothetical protein